MEGFESRHYEDLLKDLGFYPKEKIPGQKDNGCLQVSERLSYERGIGCLLFGFRGQNQEEDLDHIRKNFLKF